MNKQIFGWSFPDIAMLLLSSIVAALAEQVLPSSPVYQELSIPPFVPGALAGLFCAALILRADRLQRKHMYRWMLASAMLVLGLLVWRFGQVDLINPVRIILAFGVLGLVGRAVLRRFWPLIAGVALAGALIGLVVAVRSASGGMLLWAGAGGLIGGGMAAYSLIVLQALGNVLLDRPSATPLSRRPEPHGN